MDLSKELNRIITSYKALPEPVFIYGENAQIVTYIAQAIAEQKAEIISLPRTLSQERQRELLSRVQTIASNGRRIIFTASHDYSSDFFDGTLDYQLYILFHILPLEIPALLNEVEIR